MSRSIPALFETLVFYAMAGVVFAQYAALETDPNAADWLGILQLTVIGFIIGGTWSIFATFGMVPPVHRAFQYMRG